MVSSVINIKNLKINKTKTNSKSANSNKTDSRNGPNSNQANSNKINGNKTNILKNKLILSHLIQTSLVIFIGICFYVYSGAGFTSALLGGLVCVVPSAIFAVVFLKTLLGKQFSAERIISNFYLAEVIKFFVTGLMFFLCIFFVKLNPLAFFVGFIVAQMTNWIFNFLNLKGVSC